MPDSAKQRHSRQRDAVQTALSQSQDFITAKGLLAQMNAAGSKIGLATVYRNLNDMALSGHADVIQTTSEGQLFRSCGDQHHHHLVCVRCGKTVEVNAPIESWINTLALEHGFGQIRHTVDIFGTCTECQNTEKGSVGSRP